MSYEKIRPTVILKMIGKTKIQIVEETCFWILCMIRNTTSRCAGVKRDELFVRDFFLHSSFVLYSEFISPYNVSFSIKKNYDLNNGMYKFFFLVIGNDHWRIQCDIMYGTHHLDILQSLRKLAIHTTCYNFIDEPLKTSFITFIWNNRLMHA